VAYGVEQVARRVRRGRNGQIQNQQGDGDGDDPVTERFETLGAGPPGPLR
jgi:hypothetical protein